MISKFEAYADHKLFILHLKEIIIIEWLKVVYAYLDEGYTP